MHLDDRCCRKFQSTFDANAERLSARGDGWATDAGPAIAGNWVVGYDFTGNPVAGYDVADTWGAGYDVADVPIVGDVLSATGSPFTLGILLNTHMLYVFTNKHTCISIF
jgi:hypothetical protein